ncbi:phospholipid phosphatase 1 [Elysia marginata]|uniref:Phospholipid phosphatase 1 n=1 Tax=Elysia marginata TaxID=1093978 RepID=A0AAV4EV41_9GAST|nr:phospholipid phosphatase 1 [Elysia marginata]
MIDLGPFGCLDIPARKMERAFTALSVCGSLVALNALGEPGSTGFWCHDQSISLPYKPDSISKRLLLTIGFGAPLCVIVLTESIRLALANKKTCPLKVQLINVVKAYGVFMFGMAADVLLTEMLKYSVGRLRPHFFDICKPTFELKNCSAYVWPEIQ